jgi:hypothetical protein
MPIITKDQAQDKIDRKVDRSFFKKKKQKFVPLIERNFKDLISLADQIEWVKLKKIQKEKEKYGN